MTEPTTPADLVRTLGIQECVSSLVNLAKQNPQTSVLEGIIELAMTIGAHGMCTYSDRALDPEIVKLLRDKMNFWRMY